MEHVILETGDTVHLKGDVGGPMLVTDFDATKAVVHCLWFGPDASVRTHSFPLALIQIPEAQPVEQPVQGVEQPAGAVLTGGNGSYRALDNSDNADASA